MICPDTGEQVSCIYCDDKKLSYCFNKRLSKSKSQKIFHDRADLNRADINEEEWEEYIEINKSN